MDEEIVYEIYNNKRKDSTEKEQIDMDYYIAKIVLDENKDHYIQRFVEQFTHLTYKAPDLHINFQMCLECNEPYTFDERNAVKACLICGYSECIQVFKSSYQDEMSFNKKTLYKKLKAFKDNLERITCLNRKELTNDVVPIIRKNIIGEITVKKVKKCLKDNGYKVFFKYKYYVFYQLTGRKVIINSDQERKLIQMFNELHTIFNTLKERKLIVRKNIYKYEFILFKFFEMLNIENNVVENPIVLKKNRLIHEEEWKLITDYSSWF